MAYEIKTPLSPAELEKAWSYSKPPLPLVNSTICQLVEVNFKAHPNATALSTTWQGQVTYTELDELTANLSTFLLESVLANRGAGAENGDPEQRKEPLLIPILFEKSTWAVVAMVAILRAGAAFVPLDPKQPTARRDAVLARTNAECVLTSEECAPLMDQHAASDRTVVIFGKSLADKLSSKYRQRECGGSSQLVAPPLSVETSATAYVMFTSGSTGEPKGVVVDHATAASSCLALGARLGMGQGTRVVQFSAYTFDACVFEILGTLIWGGTVCILSEDERVNSLAKAITALKAEVFVPLTPTVARSMSASEVPYLHTVCLGGEAVTQADIDRWTDVPHLLNVYGPTETCIICVANDIRHSESNGLILGQSFASATWVVDPEDHDVLIRPGQVGELLVEGILATGYLGQPELTAQAFIENPLWLIAGSASRPGRKGRVYKTGDLVRHHSDGSGRLVFVGRKDSQVKIRGNRIELEDIEHHLRDCLPVSAAVAGLITPTPGAQEFADNTRQILAGFLVGYESALPSEVNSSYEDLNNSPTQVKLSTQEASSLRQCLPDHMVPSTFFRIGRLPTTSSGKLDRKLLRTLGSRAMSDEPCLDMTASNEQEEVECLHHPDAQSLDRIWQLNQDPPPRPPRSATCLHHLFEKQAEMTPDSTAVCGWDGDFTYAELNRMSSIFASHLAALGVGPNTVVPMIFETSSWAVVAILGILKVGAAFVGIDGRQLPERRDEMVERVHADIVLVSESLALTVSKSLHVKHVVTVSSETLDRLIKSGLDPFNRQDSPSRSDAVCYIIFTSGTTGIPKGVVTEHGAICTSVLAHITRMGVDNRSRVLQFSVCSFDACIMEIFPALASGGVVCVPSTAERTDGGLEHAVARMHVNFFIVTPSVSRLIKASVTGRTTVVLVGEAASASDLIGWGEQVRLLNGYGPTECSAGCVMHDISQKALSDSSLDTAIETRVIGKAVACVTWIVDLDDQSKLAPFQAEGELFIEGSILARGYLDDEKTCEAFINDPIWLSKAPHGRKGRRGRVYKTGDVVRYNTDGNLIYIGRRDSQIKLRGQRVELGDIERHLQTLSLQITSANNVDIDAVVVEMVATSEQSVSRGTLIALFLLSHGKEETGATAGSLIVKDGPPTLKPFPLSPEQLSGISEQLPQFMTPSQYLEISRLPTTSAGKTDRRRLRELILSYLSECQKSADTGLLLKLTHTRDPSTEIECRLHELWAQILGLEPNQFGVDCDFLRLGGDSLVAMHLCAMARKAGLIISSRDILTKKTIARLALGVRTVQPSSDSAQDYRLSRTPKRIRDEDDLECSPLALSPVQKLYFDVNNQLDTKMEQSYYLEVKDTLTYESLDAAFKAVITMHPMLRVRLTPDEGTWLQSISPSVEESYRLVRASLSSREPLEDSFANARASLNIQTGPIVSAVFFECHPQRLFISISHLAVDTVSWQIILEDLTEFLHTNNIPTPPQTSFPTWCKRQAAYVSSCHQVVPPFPVSSPEKYPESYLRYWGLAGKDEGSYQDGHSWSTISFSLDRSDTQKLLTSCNEAYETEPAMLLVAALVVSFKQVFPDRSLPHLFQEGHGRESWDAELDPCRTVGWFTTVFQIPLDGFKTIPDDFKSSNRLCDVVRRAKDAMKGLARKGWFDFTSRMLTTPKDKGTDCLAELFPIEVMFNYLGTSSTTGSTGKSEDGIFSMLPIPGSEYLSNRTRLSALIQVEAAVALRRLQVDIHHNSNMRHHEKLAQWARSFESTLKEMITVLESNQRDWTLADFPETFASYDDLDRFRKESLPSLSIPAEDVEDVFLMTPLQHGMYTGHVKDPGAYMLVFTFECSARDTSTNVAVEPLCAAWAFIVQRHPLLRAVIIDALPGTSNPGFVVLRAPQVTVRVEKPSTTSSKTHVFLGQGCKADLLHKLSITMENDNMMKCSLEINHIIFDAHSKSLVLKDLQGFLAGDRWPVAPSFRLFATHLALDNFENTEQYWKTYLDGVEPCLIPTGPRGGTSGKVSVRTETLPGVPWALVKDFCRRHGSVTPANILELGWGWALRGYTGLTTVCFSHLVSSRDSTVVDADTGEEVDDNEILGPIFGNLPVRIDFESSDTVLKTASIVNQTTLDGMSHQNTSLANIHHVLGIGAGRLSNSCVALEFSTLALSSIEEERSPLVIHEISGYDPTDFDVLVSASISDNDELQISINYQAELISQNDARYLGETLRHALLWILQNPTSTWDEASLISPAHMAQIIAWNTPVPKITHGLLHQLVEAQVGQKPSAAAIHAWDGEFTYTELDNAANLIAVALRTEYGVRAGTLVPLILEKSKWTMAAMLAILKAGGAFVPVAIEPLGRMDRVLSQLPQGTPVVTSQLYASLVGAQVKEENLLIVGEQLMSRMVSASNSPALLYSPDWAQPGAPAYVIFTSGTTGDPKGVVIQHASITTAILAQGRAFGYSSATRSYQFTSYTFDASITEIFATLSNGGCLCIPSETTRLDLDGTAEAIKAMRVNTCFFTPTLARLLQPSRLQCVTTLILGGEAVDEGLVAMWSHVPKVFCLYGPSEASICCASYEICRDGKDDGIKPETMMGVVGCPIGKALASVSWIVDRNDHHKLAPLGAYGELLVDGPIVGKGYLDDDAKTNSVFISDLRWMPPSSRSSRMYKTGDLVRYLPDGTLLFQGRKDSQVKINGQRIELGEVEFHVRKVMPVKTACVVAEIVALSSEGENDSATAQKATKKLVVVVGLEDGNGDDGDGHESGGDLGSPMKPLHLSSEVFAELETWLPIYMVPSIFFAMPKNKIPTSASGKTDRKQLRNLVSSQFSLSALAQAQREANKTVKQQPVTEIQRQLQTIWAEVLGQDPQAIGLDDTFFRVGGTSLTAMTVTRQANHKFGLGVLFSHLVKGLTLAELAAKCKNAKQSNQDSITPFSLLGIPTDQVSPLREDLATKLGIDESQIEDCFPCTPLQEGLISMTEQNPKAYVARHVFILSNDLDLVRFREAWDVAAQSAPILRSRISYSHHAKALLQVAVREKTQWVTQSGVHHAGSLPVVGDDASDLMGLGTRLAHYTIIIDEESRQSWLIWTIHHALYDGYTLPLIMDLVTRAYYSLGSGPVQPKSLQFLVQHTKALEPADVKSWWVSYLSNLSAVHFPGLSKERPPPTSKGEANDGTAGFLERIVRIPSKSSEVSIEGDMAFSTMIHAAWALVISKMTGSNDVVFGAMLPGRHHGFGDGLELDNVIGPTLALVPVRIIVKPGQNVRVLLETVQSQAIGMSKVEQVGIQNLVKFNRDTQFACGFQTLLSVQPAAEQLAEIPSAQGLWEWCADTTPVGRGLEEYGLTLQVITPGDNRGDLVVKANFDNSLVSSKVMSFTLGHFVCIMERLFAMRGSLADTTLVSDMLANVNTTGDYDLPVTVVRPNDLVPSRLDANQKGHPKTIEDEAVHLDHERERRPSTLVERLLQQLWAEVLEIDPDLISVDDSFVRLGGDSVLAMQLASLARDYHLQISPRDVLGHSKTISSLAISIEEKKKSRKSNPVQQQPLHGTEIPENEAQGTHTIGFKCSSNIEVHQLETLTLPKLGISANEVEDVFPCSPLQEGIVLSQVSHPESYWNSLVFDVVSSRPGHLGILSSDKLHHAWDLVVQRHAILRALLVDALPGRTEPGFVVLKSLVAKVSHLRVPKEIADATCMDVEYFRRLNPGTTATNKANDQRQHYLTVCEVYTESQVVDRLVVCLHFNHVILDGHSQFVLMNDLRAAYTGTIGLSVAPSYSQFIAHTKGAGSIQAEAEALAHWKRFMESVEPCILPAKDTDEFEESQIKTLYVCNVPREAIVLFHHNSEATTATLVQAAWAMTLERFTGLSKVIFGVGSSVRDMLQVPGITEMVGPVISLLLCQVDFTDACITGRQLLHQIGSDIQDALPHQNSASLATVLHGMGYNGVRNKLFNTAINLQSPAHNQTSDIHKFDIDIVPRASQDVTEFDVALSSTDTLDGLHVSMNYKSAHMSSHQASKVSTALAKSIWWITQNLDAPLPEPELQDLMHPIRAKSSHDALPAVGAYTETLETTRSGTSGPTMGPVEVQLQRLFCRALNLPEEQIRAQDDFFRLGGDSVAAIQISSWARSKGYDITVRDIMTRRTIANLATLIPEHSSTSTSGTTAQQNALEKPSVSMIFPLAPLQDLYFNIQGPPQPGVAFLGGFDQSILLRLARPFSYSRIIDAFQAVVHLHPMLRARISANSLTGKTALRTQEITADVDGSCQVRRVSLPHSSEASSKSIACAINEARDNLDAVDGPVLTVVLFEGGGLGQQQSMFVAIHHLMVDLVSWRIILRDLEEFLTTAKITVSPTSEYQEWCQSLALFATSKSTEQSRVLRPSRLSYWGVDAGQNTMENMVSRAFIMEANLTERLLAADGCNSAFGTNLPILLIAALISSFRRVFHDRPEPVVWNEQIGRDPLDDEDTGHLDVSGTVGWFTSLTPVEIDGHRDANIADVVRRVKDCIMTPPPQGWHRWLASEIANGGVACQWPAEIIFNYLGLFQQLERPDALFTRDTSSYPTGLSNRESQIKQFSIIDVTASITAAPAQCLEVFVRYNRHVKHSSKIEAWIDTLQQTIESMVPILDDIARKAPQWTLSDFPGVFSHYDDVEEFRNRTTSNELRIPPDEVEDVLLLSPLQQGIFLSQAKDPESYHTAILMEIARLHEGAACSVGLDKLTEAWQCVVGKHSLLRALIVESLPGNALPGLVVQRTAKGIVRHLAQNEMASASADNFRSIEWWRQYYDPVQMYKAGLQHHLTLAEHAGKFYACLEVNHLMVDAASTSVLLRDWKLAYEGSLDRRVSSYRQFGHLTSKFSQANEEGKEDPRLLYWRDQLQGLQPCLLRMQDGLTSETNHRQAGSQHSRVIATLQLPSIRTFCSRYGFTIANVMQMAWALSLNSLTGHSTVIFGHAVSAQPKQAKATRSSAEGFVGPVIRLMPCRVNLYGGAETVIQVLERIRDDSAQDAPNQDVPLASITNMLRLPRLFNTALTVQAPVIKPLVGLGTAERSSKLEIRQIGGYDPSEFDVTVNVIDNGESLDVHVVYREQDQHRGNQAAQNLAETIREALVDIVEGQDPATRQIASILHEDVAVKHQLPSKVIDEHQVEVPGGDASRPESHAVSPRTNMERRLQILCAKVIGADPDNIDLRNDFFSIGGDSAAAMQLVAEAYRTGLAITVRQVMSSPTLAALAEVASFHPVKLASDYQPFSLVSERQRGLIMAELTSSWASDRTSILEVDDILPTTDMQAYCIQMGLKEPSLARNYVCFDIHPRPSLCEDRVRVACRSIMRHFSLLRTVFVRQDGKLWQVVLSERELLSEDVPILRKYHVGELKTLDQAYNAVCFEDMKGAQSGAQLGHLTVTFMLFEKSEQQEAAAESRKRYKFAMRLSHAQYDGVSLPLILRALADAYNGVDLNPTVPFGAFIAHLSQQEEKSLAFWRRKLQGATMTRIMPTLLKQRRQNHQTGSICLNEELLDQASSGYKRVFETTSRVLTMLPLAGSRPRYTSATLVAAAWALVLSSLTQRRDVIFGQVVAGRNARLPHIHEVCGPTSTILPLRVRLGAEWVGGDLLRHVQEQSTGVGDFDAPLGLWREVFGELRSDNGGVVVDTTTGGGYVFPFEIVLLHQSNIEEEQLVCPFGKGTIAKPNLLEEERAPPYVCIKSKLGTHTTESADAMMSSIRARGHSHRNVRQHELLLSIEAPSTKMDAQTAAWLLEMLADAVSALSGESEMKLAEIKSRLGSR